MNTPLSGESQHVEAMLLAKDIATRAKLLKQAKTRIHLSDLVHLLLGIFLLVLAYWELKSLNTSESRVFFPATNFALGMTFINQTYIVASFRRLDALVQLFENLPRKKS